ncbi:MAG: LTA synthase family protein [Peptococcaceae bacterium]|nr:LTA synthase family protein [Peptococcaceae bacterium]
MELAFYVVLIVFLLVNVIKITFFNLIITGQRKFTFFLYKFAFTLIITLWFKLYLVLCFPVGMAIYYILEVLFLYIGVSYFNFYHYFLHLRQSLRLLRESLELVRYKSVPRSFNQLLALIDLPFMIALLVLNYLGRLPVIRFNLAALFFACMLLVLIFELGHALRGKSILQLVKTYPQSEQKVVANYGTLINMLLDFCLFFNKEKVISQFDYGRPKKIKSREITGSEIDLSYKSNKPDINPNIIAIQVESLDANSVNLHFQDSPVMPYLDSLKNTSIYFPYMMNYHKAGGTSDAEFSIINSVEPLSKYPSIKLTGYNNPNSFVKILAANGYRTAVFHGNKGSYYQRHKAFASMGFAEFYDLKKMGLRHVGWGAPDHEVFAFMLKEMKEQVEPFFYYLITMSNHCRFTNVLNYYWDKRFDSIKNKELKLYFNSLSYVDTTIHSFVRKVNSLLEEKNKREELKSARKTYILIFGDHTPGLKKKIYREATLEIENRHLEFVPFYILSPERIVYQETAKAASFLDIGPTILDLARIDTFFTTYGESLMPPHKLSNKIPYRDYWFDREQLYQRIKREIT